MAQQTPDITRRALLKSADVCELAKVQPYVLRSWEKEFPDLGFVKADGGPRYYRQADVDRVLRIKQLVFAEGLTLSGARRRLDEERAAQARRRAAVRGGRRHPGPGGQRRDPGQDRGSPAGTPVAARAADGRARGDRSPARRRRADRTDVSPLLPIDDAPAAEAGGEAEGERSPPEERGGRLALLLERRPAPARRVWSSAGACSSCFGM